jgi:hypothetical protein
LAVRGDDEPLDRRDALSITPIPSAERSGDEEAIRISVRAICAGDAIRLHDWTLHVVAVDHDIATAMLTTEFKFPIHFNRQDSIELVDRTYNCSPAA